MPEQDTRSLIETYFAAFNANDTNTLLSLLDEDVVHDINEGGREIGREKFSWFLGDMSRHYRERLDDIVIMVSGDGNRAAAEFTARGTYLATAEGMPPAHDQSYSIASGIFFEVDDGRISRVTSYCNQADWIRQVGADAGA